MPQTIPHSSRWHIFRLPVFLWPAVQRFSVWQWIRIQWKRIKISQSCVYDIINVYLLSIVCTVLLLINATRPSELNIRRKGCACLKENWMGKHPYLSHCSMDARFYTSKGRDFIHLISCSASKYFYHSDHSLESKLMDCFFNDESKTTSSDFFEILILKEAMCRNNSFQVWMSMYLLSQRYIY